MKPRPFPHATPPRVPPRIGGRAARALALIACTSFGGAVLFLACSDGRDGAPGAPALPPPTSTTLTRFDEPPGVAVAIVALEGASGADGGFRVGDRPRVRFRLEKTDGTRWRLDEMVHARAMLSGPTFRYQRVIPEREDVAQLATSNADGSYTYTFPVPIPATYVAPYNDSESFGPDQGELAGQPLLAGTYTVGMSFVWRYTLEGREHVDAGEAVRDLRFGGAAALEPRAVVGQANCERCHVALEAHGGERRLVRACLLCHTAGAEDLNDPAVGSGTPGQSIDSRVLFHKIHNAAHLPSVLGVRATESGAIDYAVEPRPYVLATAAGELRDFSHVSFPAWPNRTAPMPKDFGFSGLSPEARAKDTQIRRGVTSCAICHGDPDGEGPLEAPAQGDLIYSAPQQEACGACHDDVVWEFPYTTNGSTMEPQLANSGCNECHEPSGGSTAILDGHRHPLSADFSFLGNGLVLELLALREAGDHDADGTIDVGERVELELRLIDRSGNDVPASQLGELRAVLSGPNRNQQLLLNVSVPLALLSGPQPYLVRLPERLHLEHVGDSSSETDEFTTARAPHLALVGAQTVVRARVGTAGGSTFLAAATASPANALDVLDAAGFDPGDILVVDDGIPGREEYAEVRLVEGDRIWLGSPALSGVKPGLALAHGAGSTVREVQLATLTLGVDYSLDPATGAIGELVELGAGTAVLVDYVTEFELPARYPLALHDSPDLGPDVGQWTGLPVVPGTYALSLMAWRTAVYNFALEQNPYRVAAPAVRREFPVAGAAQIEPYSLLESMTSCQACHQDLMHHDERYRGLESCLACHGTAGAPARAPDPGPRARSACLGAPATPGTSIGFRRMLHRIHMGRALSHPLEHVLVGGGVQDVPNDFELRSFEHVLFPAMPGAARRCAVCHGDASSAWHAPGDLEHPAAVEPAQAWRMVCLACHDSQPARSHADAQTAPDGSESCLVCHAPGKPEAVELRHRPRSPHDAFPR